MSSSVGSSSSSLSARSSPGHGAPRCVVTVKASSPGAKSDQDSGGSGKANKLLPGDIVEEVVCSDGLKLSSPFAGGKAGLQRELRRLYSSGHTSLTLNVRRNHGGAVSVRASIAPDESSRLKKLYALKSPFDPSYVVAFADSTEAECLALQEKRCARMISQLSKTQLADRSVPYKWEEKRKAAQPSAVFSMIVIPHGSGVNGAQFVSLEDTVTRAMTWLSASQMAGVPISFLSIQTEPLLTKVSGQEASSRSVSSCSVSDLSNVANTGIYGFEDYHGIDLGVVRAVRVWYVPNFSEISVRLKVEDDETRIGLGISQTEEGFCYVSSVDPGTAADRAGLRHLVLAAHRSHKVLVLTRVLDEKVTPWLVSSSGNIRCFDTTSISQKLSVQWHVGQPIRLHLMALEAISQTMALSEDSGPSGHFSYGSESANSTVVDLIKD